MGIVRSWLRGVLGASGMTLLVPAGLLVALVVAAAVGGSGLGSVGQLIGGPEVPGISAAVPSGERALPAVPARRGVRGPAGGDARAAALREQLTRRSTGAKTRRGSKRPQSRDRGGTSNPSTTPPPATPGQPPPATPPGATPPPPPPAAPQPERNPVRRLGKAVTDLVRPLPLVGPPVADAVGTVIDLIAPPAKPRNLVTSALPSAVRSAGTQLLGGQ